MTTKRSIRSGCWRAVLTASAIVLSFAASAAANETIIYFHQDALGSVRLVTGNDGEVLARHDYLPFGEEVPAGQFGRAPEAGYGATDGVPQRFTGKERDTESDLDYFGARYYSGAQGRFTSADDIWNDMDVADPASWNRYVYVRNNPLRYVDPDGTSAWSNIWKGDFDTEETTWGGVAGQVGVGCIPIVGQIADVRDTAAGVAEVRIAPSSGKAWVQLGLAAVAWIPVFGDGAKGVVKVGKKVGTEVAEEATEKLAKEGLADTSRAARREAQRQAGIPTSRGATSQTGPGAGGNWSSMDPTASLRR